MSQESGVELPPPAARPGLPADGGERFNRLIHAASPYLLQHAANPVDWFPWGEEAFARARAEDRPVFLSIGYSSCHWCHVMERESFADREVAELLNRWFISIKVDREERPDVDNIYMAAVQAMHGQGGWPLSLFLTPEGKPFYGATYLPPEDRMGQAGFKTILEKVHVLWEEDRERLTSAGERLTRVVADMARPRGEARLGQALLERAFEDICRLYDRQDGGFGRAPKFPRSHLLTLLLRLADGERRERALAMVSHTLDRIDRGGIHDHLGGGFHRYSTDREWLVPHFEKMLYDQALLTLAAVEAWQVTGEESRARMARDICDYVLAELRDRGGAFHAAEDADSAGEEGLFYLWRREEVLRVLGREEGEFFCRVYGVTEEGNHRDEASGVRTGANILHLPVPLEEAAPGVSREELERRLRPLRAKLRECRAQRTRPSRDDKVLADWNGLMIAALARGGWVLGQEAWLRAAREAARFILEEMVLEGRLLHQVRQGKASVPAFLDDHAFLVLGLMELYQATLEPGWLAEARDLADEMIRLFWDGEAGGFRFSGGDREGLIAPTKELYDGALPSGNSAATLALARLSLLAGEERFEELARRNLRFFSGAIERAPEGCPFMLAALHFLEGPGNRVVLTGRDVASFHRALARAFLPRTVILRDPDVGTGGAEARLCRGRTCLPPARDPETLLRLLAEDR